MPEPMREILTASKDMAQEIFDETSTKVLIQALAARTDTETLVAMHALRRLVGDRTHDIKVFFAKGEAGTWMQSILRLNEYDRGKRTEADHAARRYRDRLVQVEAALLVVRRVLKDLPGSDHADPYLQDAIRNAPRPSTT